METKHPFCVPLLMIKSEVQMLLIIPACLQTAIAQGDVDTCSQGLRSHVNI